MNHRRKLVFLLGMSGLAAPARVFAQRVYRIAVLIHGTKLEWGTRFEALRTGLRALGYVEGKNLILSVRWNEGGLERLPDLAAELLRDKPDVFVGSPVLSAAAAHKHSKTIPIVIANGAGAVKIGLAQSLARPGGNVTGVESQQQDLVPKHIELLKTIAPAISRVGVLNTGKFLYHDEAWRSATQAAKVLKLTLIDLRVEAPSDLARIASTCGKGGCDALYVMPDPILVNWRVQIIERAAQLRLPVFYTQSEFTREGGLISYSADTEDLFRRAATHVDKILKGAKPGDLAIEQPTKFNLAVNLKTAKALGITIPQSILVSANEVIE